MKKKILALALCLVLCLPFVLTSCFGGSDDLGKVIASFKPEYEPSFNSYSTSAFEGEVLSQNGKFVFTRKDVPETITREVLVDNYYDPYYGYYRDVYEYRDVATKTTHVYRVYNVLTSSEIYSATTAYISYNYNSYNGGYYGTSGWETSLTNVSITEFGEDLFVLKEEDYSTTYKVIDATGYCQLSSSSADLEYDIIHNLDKEAVIFDNTLYLFDTETNVLSSAKTFKENSIEGFVRDLYQVGDKYVLLNDSDVYVFDSQFKQLYGTNFKTFAVDKFESDMQVFKLNSGDILVQIQHNIGSYENLYDDKYDFIVEGDCYRLETYLYTVDNGSYEEIDCSYVIDEVVTKDVLVENLEFIGLPDDAENIAIVYVIEDEGVVYKNNNMEIWATLSNDGDCEIIEVDDLGDFAVALNDTRYMIQGEFFTRIYNEKGELIGELGNVKDFNKNFIVTNEAIYDMNLNVVVTLDDDTSYYDKTDDSIIYKEENHYSSSSKTYYIAKYDDYGYTTTSQIVTDEFSSYSYYTSASLTVSDRFYAVVRNNYTYYVNEPSSRSITFYQTNGYEIARYDLPISGNASDYIHSSTFDDCVVYSIESSTGNYFVTLKTVANSTTY